MNTILRHILLHIQALRFHIAANSAIFSCGGSYSTVVSTQSGWSLLKVGQGDRLGVGADSRVRGSRPTTPQHSTANSNCGGMLELLMASNHAKSCCEPVKAPFTLVQHRND